MSNLWWLEPGWKQTCCAHCGTNIWDSGGDPDHGLCFRCWNADFEAQQAKQEDERLEDKIEALIAEFGDDPAAALQCISEHISLRRHSRATGKVWTDDLPF